MTDDYKVAAINWLLLYGKCDWMMHSTSEALRTLAKRGVDYDESQLPKFDSETMVNDGDTSTDATYADGISANIVPLGKRHYNTIFTFVVDTSSNGDRPGLSISDIIPEVIEIGETIGETGWRDRFSEQWARQDAHYQERRDRISKL